MTVVSKVFGRLPFEPLWLGKVPDTFEIESAEFLEGQLVISVAHDDDEITAGWQDFLVFLKNLPKKPPCTIALDGVTHSAGSDDADPPRRVIHTIPGQELEEEKTCLE